MKSTKGKIFLIIVIAIFLSPFVYDTIGTIRIIRVWKQPDNIQYSLLNKLVLEVEGHQTPIRFWDLDSDFELTITYGGYIYERTIDLIDGQDNYKDYLQVISK